MCTYEYMHISRMWSDFPRDGKQQGKFLANTDCLIFKSTMFHLVQVSWHEGFDLHVRQISCSSIPWAWTLLRPPQPEEESGPRSIHWYHDWAAPDLRECVTRWQHVFNWIHSIFHPGQFHCVALILRAGYAILHAGIILTFWKSRSHQWCALISHAEKLSDVFNM